MAFELKSWLVARAEWVHEKLFGHPMGEVMRQFLGQLSWSFFGGLLTAGIMFLLTIVAGRLLGPEVYGEYNALLSFATALSAIFLLGMNVSSVRFLSDGQYAEQRGRILTSSLFGVGGWMVVVSLLTYLLSRYFPWLTGGSEEFLGWGLSLAAVLTVKNMLDGFLRAYQKIRFQSLIRSVEALLIISLFLGLVGVWHFFSAYAYAAAMLTGGLVFIGAALWSLRTSFAGYDWQLLKKIFVSYNRFLIITSMLGMLVAADRFLIGRFIGLSELGIFGAYYTASHLVVAELTALFLNVFWPTVIAQADNLPAILGKSRRFFIGLAPLWVGLIFLNTAIFVFFFGSAYPLRLDYLVLFSVNTFLGALFSIYSSFLNIHHVRRTVLANLAFTAASIGTLVVSRSIVAYLVAQIIIQIVLVYLIMVFLSHARKRAA